MPSPNLLRDTLLRLFWLLIAQAVVLVPVFILDEIWLRPSGGGFIRIDLRGLLVAAYLIYAACWQVLAAIRNVVARGEISATLLYVQSGLVAAVLSGGGIFLLLRLSG